jgi:hypothetical protein
MPSKSKSQQRLMGLALSYKRGKKKLKDLPASLSKKIKKMSKSMTDDQLSDFAKTKHKDLPQKVSENIKSFSEFLKYNSLNEGILTDIKLGFIGISILSSCAINRPNVNTKIINELNLRTPNKIEILKVNKIKDTLKTLILNDKGIDDTIKNSIISNIDSIKIFISDKESSFRAGHIKKSKDIMLSKQDLDDSPYNILKNIISHEMIHSINELNLLKDTISDFVDIKIKRSLYDKMSFNMVIKSRAAYLYDKFYEYDKGEREKFINECLEYYTIQKINYITSKEEMFTRYINLKLWLISEGQLKTITDPINIKHIYYVIDAENISEMDFMDLIFILDLNKLE